MTNSNRQIDSVARIKSVVVDLGGVLFTEGKGVALKVLLQDYGYDPAIVMQVITSDCSRDSASIS